MTIQFNCPSCGELIAFDDKHAGKRARCLSCGQIFIIPQSSDETPQKIEPKVQKVEPVPGFYTAVFVDSWKIFIDRQNATALVFVTAVVCFRFFLAPAMCCGYITSFIVWGWLLGFYLNLIYETASGMDKLPEIYLGTGGTFFWYIVKPFLVFFITFFVMELPFIICLSLFREKQVTVENMWQFEFGPRLLLQIFFLLGLFLFPAAILSTSVAKDITLLRPDYLLKPISKAFTPYLVVFVLLVAFVVIETLTRQYTGASLQVTAGYLILNLAVQVTAITAMRSIGLFYRHYNCYFDW